MQEAGLKYAPVIYAGAGHGFMRSGEDPNGSAADKQARQDAWQRWLKLLKSM
jgi:carboxymethylenebutenolidase